LKTDAAGRRFIRANQGHTIQSVADEELLSAISDPALFPVVVHGTTHRAWLLIQATGGLKRMARNHIHFAQGLPGDSGVISGMRSSSEIIIRINLAQALADGIPFFVSDNGVILTPGVGPEGLLPIKYIQSVVQTKPHRVLFET
jgi:RNA:NAD 2'-phosphotransferase (TPT1/KptA family)